MQEKRTQAKTHEAGQKKFMKTDKNVKKNFI